MEPIKLLQDNEDVDKRLEKMGLRKSDLIQVVKEAVLSRNSCTDNDTRNAPGMLAYFSGTRALRELHRPQGWEVDRKDSVESIINANGTIKIIYQNVDCASKKSQDPKARSKKGPGSERTVAENQMSLFSDKELGFTTPAKKTAAWYLCVSVKQDGFSAELSLPRSLDGGQFSGFLERIFILKDEKFTDFPLSNLNINDDTDFNDFEVQIARK